MRYAPLAIALLGMATPWTAQAQDDLRDDEQIIIAQVQADRRAVVARNLELTTAESDAFWPIYDSYEAASKRITDQRVRLLNDYAAKYGSLSDAEADAMLERRLRLDRDASRLKLEYAKKLRKALPGVKALRYAQVQDRIENLLAAEMYLLVPLAR